jgi:membrane protein DedA with SNARE-associated domain
VTLGREHLPRVLGTLAAAASCSLVGVAFAPALLIHAPLALIALSPLGRHMVMVATVTDPLPFVVVGAARKMVACGLAWALGQIYGPEGIEWVEDRYPRLGSMARWLERLFARAGAPLVVVAPLLSVCALAGAARMPLRRFLPLAAVGQVIWTAATYAVGDAMSAWISPVTEFIARYMVETTLACVAAVVAYQALRRRNRRTAALAELRARGEDGPR